MDMNLIEHLKYLKEKGLYDITIHDNYVSAFDNYDLNIFKTENSPKKLYHCTPFIIAKKIIKDGYLKGISNKESIKYNKVFFSYDQLYWKIATPAVFSWEHYNLFREYIVFEINAEDFQIYNYINDSEWFIYGDVDIKNSKMYHVKTDLSINEITKEEILKYEYVIPEVPKPDPEKIKIELEKLKRIAWIEAKRKIAALYRGNKIADLLFLDDFESSNIEFHKGEFFNNRYIVKEKFVISEKGKSKQIKSFIVDLNIEGNSLIYSCTINKVDIYDIS